MIDMLDKPLNVLKDDPGFTKLNWFTYFRLETTLVKCGNRNPGLMSKGVNTPL